MTPTQKHQWTADEIAELRHLYPDTPDDELVERFGVSIVAIRHVAHRYNIRRRDGPSSRDTWTPERTQFLIDNVATMTYTELAGQLGVAPITVRTKAMKLGLQRPYGWTDKRIERLRAEAGQVSVAEMARRLGLSEETVRQKMKQLGLTPPPRQRRWTDQRIAEFCAAYPVTPKKVLAERYGLSVKSVGEIASRLRARKAQSGS